MEKGKILLYDTQKKFFKILKYGFKKDFLFDAYLNLIHFEEQLHGYSSAIFVIYCDHNLADFMKIREKGIPIIACTSKIEFFEELKSSNEVFLFDTSKIKSEMVLELNNFFRLKSFYCVRSQLQQ